MKLNVKLLGVFLLGGFLTACSNEAPQTAEVVYQEKEVCNVEGSVAHFKQDKKDQVFFNFDRSQILCEGEKVPAMKDFVCKYNKTGSIVGHCDTRGSSEYNLALGQRRAHALAKSLKKHGLPQDKICGVYSVGKERPLVSGNTEECHAQNRTSIFVLADSTSGAETAVVAEAPTTQEAKSDTASEVSTSSEE